MSNQVNVPILANNKIRKHNMSDIKQVKLNKTIQASIKATGLVIPNYLNSNKVLQQATGKVDIEAFIIIGNMISVYSHDWYA